MSSYEVVFEYQGASANLVIWDDGKTAILHTLSSAFRRRGSASKVLRLSLDYADLLNREVVLEVVPYGDEPLMSKEDLMAWYMTYGFVKTGGRTMLRKVGRNEEKSNDDK